MVLSFPPLYGVLSIFGKANGFHKKMMKYSSLISVVILGVIVLNDIPDSDLLSFLIWRVVAISLLIYSWKLDNISIFLYLTEFLLGLIVLWKLLVFFIPVSNPLISYLLIINGSASIALIALFFIRIKAGGYKLENGHEVKKLLIILLVILGIKLFWAIGSSVLIEAEDLSGNFMLAVYLWNYLPVISIGGLLLSAIVPAILASLLFIEKVQIHLKPLLIVSFLCVILGEFFFKYLLVQYGFSF